MAERDNIPPDDPISVEPKESLSWMEAIDKARQADQTWHDCAKDAEKEFGAGEAGKDGYAAVRGLPMFWADMSYLRPAIYTRPPQPVIQARYPRSGPEVHAAAELLERYLEAYIEIHDFHSTMLAIRDDMTLSGRGVGWMLGDGRCIHLDRTDFIHEPAKKWEDVSWVARRMFLTYEQGEGFFGRAWADAKFEQRQAASEIKMTGSDQSAKYKSDLSKAIVWEVWSREHMKIYHVTEGVDRVLKETDPYAEFPNFFPCPKPVYSTRRPMTLQPVPDHVYLKRALDEIDDLTVRLDGLQECLRVKGFYPGGEKGWSEALETALKIDDSARILVKVSAHLSAGEKMSDKISWLPIEQVAITIREVQEARRRKIDDVREISGISDLQRAQTDPNETARAQTLKQENAGMRLRPRQGEMARMALELLILHATYAATKIPVEQMQALTMMPLDANLLQPVQQLLSNNQLRAFLVDIETDSTLAPDEEQTQRRQVEYFAAITDAIQKVAPVAMQMPQVAPLFAQLVKNLGQSFSAGRDTQAALDQFADQMAQQAQAAAQAQQGQPDPQQVAMQIEQGRLQIEQAKAQTAQAKAQADVQVAQMKVQTEQLKAQAAMERERMKASTDQARLMLDERRAEIDAEVARNNIDIATAEQERKRAVDVFTQAIETARFEHEKRMDVIEANIEITQGRGAEI